MYLSIKQMYFYIIHTTAVLNQVLISPVSYIKILVITKTGATDYNSLPTESHGSNYDTSLSYQE